MIYLCDVWFLFICKLISINSIKTLPDFFERSTKTPSSINLIHKTRQEIVINKYKRFFHNFHSGVSPKQNFIKNFSREITYFNNPNRCLKSMSTKIKPIFYLNFIRFFIEISKKISLEAKDFNFFLKFFQNIVEMFFPEFLRIIIQHQMTFIFEYYF